MINKILKITNPSQIRQVTLKKLPDTLIWHKASRLEYHEFLIFSTKDSNNYAKMVCRKSIQHNNGKRKPSLFISLIKAEPQENGLGTVLLNFAHKFSKEIGCEGRFFLSADGQFAPQKVPHLFYRKFGMNTEYKDINQKIDKFIKAGKNGTITDFPHTLMYYPPVPVKESQITHLNIRQYLSDLFQDVKKFAMRNNIPWVR